MRNLAAPILSMLQARAGMYACLLVWIEAKDRSTGVREPVGFWTGADHQDFNIGGETRTYYGAGAMIGTEPMTANVGLSVRTHTLRLSHIAPEVRQALRGYDPRLAPAQMHIAYFDPATHNLLADPVRVFKGSVNATPITTPGVGGSGAAEVELLSSAHSLTRPLALKKSHHSLQARSPGDDFRQYATVAGTVTTVWGGVRAKTPSKTTEKTPKPDTSSEAPGDPVYQGP
ncbi:MAG: hypothetical protein ACU0FH_02145 [Heliomarina sp.]|uniref:hypothetical protein n=1 Tax=Heliomarina sp. TaxID=2917556 RepID=UPI004059745A